MRRCSPMESASLWGHRGEAEGSARGSGAVAAGAGAATETCMDEALLCSRRLYAHCCIFVLGAQGMPLECLWQHAWPEALESAAKAQPISEHAATMVTSRSVMSSAVACRITWLDGMCRRKVTRNSASWTNYKRLHSEIQCPQLRLMRRTVQHPPGPLGGNRAGL